MNASEKRRFVNELFGTIRKSVEDNIDKMPPNWNGIQLREYIAEKFNQARHPLSRTEKARFDQDIVSLNL